MTMQIIATDQYGVTYADPTDPDFQIRFKTTNARKSVEGKSLVNYVTEIIVNDNHRAGVDSPNEALSVRLRTSGSVDNKVRLLAMLDVLTTNITSFKADSVFFGFRPNSAPSTS